MSGAPAGQAALGDGAQRWLARLSFLLTGAVLVIVGVFAADELVQAPRPGRAGQTGQTGGGGA